MKKSNMMNFDNDHKDFFDALDLLEQERGISKTYMMERVEMALINAVKKDMDKSNGNQSRRDWDKNNAGAEKKENNGGVDNIRVVCDPERKRINVYLIKTVVDEVTNPNAEITLSEARNMDPRIELGNTIQIEIRPKTFGRISAQSAKQIIVQGIREAEREKVKNVYESKRGDVVTATVVKVDPVNGNVIVDTGTSEVLLIPDQQIPGETYTVGKRIKIYIANVSTEAKGPVVKISRTDPGLVKRLFEIEIPEIQDGTVIIKSISREAGSRTKIAVESRDENVDPVGSCIGNHGSRIAGILNELGNEKIDVIKYSDVPEEYVRAALSPATVTSVTLDGEKSCRVLVSADQLSLAIGKEGQNARLAARLTGFKTIDIKTV